ncbi:MAG: TonB-dependent receptor [Deltaproteobacteria bacterium]|nr:TonB-dependent receptor [Deltaproteobacteria bacterium]
MSIPPLRCSGRHETGRRAAIAALAATALLLGDLALAADFAFLHTPPDQAAAGQDLVITGSITNAGRVKRARLRFRRIGEKSFEKVDMQSDGGDRYTAVVPASFVQTPGIEYFVVIQDIARQPHLIFASPDSPARIRVGKAKTEPKVEPKSPDKKPDGKPPDEKPVESNQVGTDHPFETQEEYELRTGLAATGSAEEVKALPLLPPLTGEEAAVGEPGIEADLLDEFAVFAAEDSTSLAASYSQKTSEAAAIISVVSRQRIAQMGARTLLDVLKSLPGVETSKDVSGFDHVAFRGVRNDAEILLLVDGHRWNNFYDGRPYWAIPADIIERVEVIRGPGSALYGTSAFMGVINVVTRETDGFWGNAGFGSYLEPQGALGGGFSFGGFTLHAAGDMQWTNGPSLPIAEDSASSVVLDRDPRDSRTQAWGFRTAAALKADYTSDLLAGGKVYGRGQLLYALRGPYIGRFDTAGPDSKLSWLVYSLDAGYRQPFLGTGYFDFRLYGDQHIIDDLWQLTPYHYEYPVAGEMQTFAEGVLSRTAYTADTVGAEALVNVPIFDVNRLVIGSQLEYLFLPDGGFLLEMNRTAEGVALPNLAKPDVRLDQNGQGRLSAAVYLQDEWQVFKPLFLTLGVRLSYFSDVNFDPLTQITPRAGLVWEIVDDLNLKLLYATAFRAPTFEEKYDQTPATFADFSPGVHLGNPDLLPEFIQTGEAGLSYDFTFAGFRYRVGGNAFFTQIRKSIDRIDESGVADPLKNSGGRDIVGAEIDARVEFTAGSYLYSTFGWLRAWQRVFDEEGAELPDESTYLTDVPQYRLNIGANLEIGDLADLHLLTMFGGERRNNVRSTLESLRTYRIPPYALVNLSLRTKPILGLFGFALSLYNVLDFPYLDDVPRPDRVTGLLPREGVSLFGSVYLEM